MPDEEALVPVEPAPIYVRPMMTAEVAREAAKEFARIKAAKVEESDCIYMVGRHIYSTLAEARASVPNARTKALLKKSGVLKLAQAFAISVELLHEEHSEDHVDITVRAHHPSGVYADGIGSCGKDERPNITRHVMRTTAYTRASNRAILALIGGGGVSAEEITVGGELDAAEYVVPGKLQPAQPTRPIGAAKPTPRALPARRATNPAVIPDPPIDYTQRAEEERPPKHIRPVVRRRIIRKQEEQ